MMVLLVTNCRET